MAESKENAKVRTAAEEKLTAKAGAKNAAENAPKETSDISVSTAAAAENVSEAKASSLSDYDNFYNRELSWLQFDMRCLSEARDTKIVPLFERLKFLAITSSNLDEFFMVRIASLKDQVHIGYKGVDIAGMTPQMQLDALSERTDS